MQNNFHNNIINMSDEKAQPKRRNGQETKSRIRQHRIRINSPVRQTLEFFFLNDLTTFSFTLGRASCAFLRVGNGEDKGLQTRQIKTKNQVELYMKFYWENLSVKKIYFVYKFASELQKNDTKCSVNTSTTLQHSSTCITEQNVFKLTEENLVIKKHKHSCTTHIHMRARTHMELIPNSKVSNVLDEF